MKKQQQMTTTTLPTKIKRSELHNLFQQFIERQDVKEALAHTIQHKRAKLLQTAFYNETNYTISPSWVYRGMKAQQPATSPVTIGTVT
jgi:hypothetical protein